MGDHIKWATFSVFFYIRLDYHHRDQMRQVFFRFVPSTHMYKAPAQATAYHSLRILTTPSPVVPPSTSVSHVYVTGPEYIAICQPNSNCPSTCWWDQPPTVEADNPKCPCPKPSLLTRAWTYNTVLQMTPQGILLSGSFWKMCWKESPQALNDYLLDFLA